MSAQGEKNPLHTKNGDKLGDLFTVVTDWPIPNDLTYSDLLIRTFEPYLKLRLLKEGENKRYHLSGFIFFPITHEPQPGTLLQCSLMGKTLLFYWNFRRKNDTESTELKSLRFNIVFDPNQYERLQDAKIFLTCVHDDPEEGSTSQTHVSDVDEL